MDSDNSMQKGINPANNDAANNDAGNSAPEPASSVSEGATHNKNSKEIDDIRSDLTNLPKTMLDAFAGNYKTNDKWKWNVDLRDYPVEIDDWQFDFNFARDARHDRGLGMMLSCYSQWLEKARQLHQLNRHLQALDIKILKEDELTQKAFKYAESKGMRKELAAKLRVVAEGLQQQQEGQSLAQKHANDILYLIIIKTLFTDPNAKEYSQNNGYQQRVHDEAVFFKQNLHLSENVTVDVDEVFELLSRHAHTDLSKIQQTLDQQLPEAAEKKLPYMIWLKYALAELNDAVFEAKIETDDPQELATLSEVNQHLLKFFGRYLNEEIKETDIKGELEMLQKNLNATALKLPKSYTKTVALAMACAACLAIIAFELVQDNLLGAYAAAMAATVITLLVAGFYHTKYAQSALQTQINDFASTAQTESIESGLQATIIAVQNKIAKEKDEDKKAKLKTLQLELTKFDRLLAKSPIAEESSRKNLVEGLNKLVKLATTKPVFISAEGKQRDATPEEISNEFKTYMENIHNNLNDLPHNSEKKIMFSLVTAIAAAVVGYAITLEDAAAEVVSVTGTLAILGFGLGFGLSCLIYGKDAIVEPIADAVKDTAGIVLKHH
jgi:phosphate/sulfate permease